jgi:beta-glucosidase-like glycosyl hydrolase
MQFGRSDAPRSVNTTRRMLASLKHFTAYSRETDRMGSLGNVSLFDLWDTYLPQYEEAMTESYAAGTMCSYYSMRLSGAPGPVTYVPSCANEYTLTTVVREYWGRPDAVHLSDCGAVVNMIRPPPAGNGYTPGSFSGAAAAALNAGMDQNSNTVSPSHLWESLSNGDTTPDRVYAAAGRVLAQRFRLGQFDPLEALPSELLALGAHSIGSAENRAAAAEGVRQGAVLVRNTAAALPLTPGRRLLVLGPTALSATAAIGDMYASPNALCPDDTGDCWPVLGQALTAGNAGGATTVLPGVAMSANDTAAWGPALAAAALGASAWDAVVLALGSDRSVAGEGSDRTDIGLPGVQEAFALAVLSAVSGSGAGAPPVTLLLVHNLPLSYDALLAHPSPPAAIVDAWAPTSHADALADLLFGRANQWGRSTLTLFPAAYAQAVTLEDMAMPASAGSAGRGYRYYDGRAGAPLIEFGQGLSGYSSFGLQCALQGGSGSGSTAAGGAAVAIACNVTLDSGSRAGDEVLTVFHRPGSDVVGRVGGAHPLPLRALRDFARVSLPGQPGSSVQVDFALVLNSSLTFNNEVGAQVLYPGTHFLDVWNGNTNNVTLTVTLTGDVVVVSAPPLPW